MGAGTLLLPGSKLEIGLSVFRWRWADQMWLYPLRQLLCRMGVYELDAVARVQGEKSNAALAGSMRDLASNRARPDRRPIRRVLQSQGDGAYLAGHISASCSLMNLLGGASKATNSGDTNSSGNAAFAVPRRKRPETHAVQGRHTRAIRTSGQSLRGILPKIASITERTNSPRPKDWTRAI